MPKRGRIVSNKMERPNALKALVGGLLNWGRSGYTGAEAKS
jgi:hypothetical protein